MDLVSTLIFAIIMYGVMISDYGFDLSATHNTSINADNKDKKDEIFSSVMIIKSVIAILYLIFLSILILFIDNGNFFVIW